MKLINSIILSICLFIIPTSLYAQEYEVNEYDVVGTINNLWNDEGYIWGLHFTATNGPDTDMYFYDNIEFPDNFIGLNSYIGEEIIAKIVIYEDEESFEVYLLGIYDLKGRLLLDINDIYKQLLLKFWEEE